MARKKVSENCSKSNISQAYARGPRFTSDQDFVRRYITPILNRTPDRYRFLIVFLDQENRLISHQSLAISHPPKRRIDLKRCLSLAKIPAGAAHCVFIHNHPGQTDPEWSEQDREAVKHLFTLSSARGLDLIDCILWGTVYYRSAYKAGMNTPESGIPRLCRGWDWQDACAAGRP